MGKRKSLSRLLSAAVLAGMAGNSTISCVEREIQLRVVDNTPDETFHPAEKDYGRWEYLDTINIHWTLTEPAGNTIVTDLSDDLLSEAMVHLGASYRSGSKGPFTFDCSGFTRFVFLQFGFPDIGLSSAEQYRRNVPVERSDLQPCDLVFFTSPRSGNAVGHVGMVVSVDSESGDFSFIHASSSEGVTISHSTEPFYANRFAGARRVAAIAAQ